MFSSKSFLVSGLIFRSLIHFEFIFECGVRKCSHFIILRVAVQFSQHHLLKSCLCPIVYSCLLCKKYGTHRCMSLFLGFLSCSIGLYFCFCAVPYCLDDCSFVLQSEVKKVDSSSSILISQDCFGYLGSSVFPYEL